MQHVVFRHLFGGLLLAPQQALLDDPTAAAKVLDIGCGPGSWTLDMALKFPRASFVGGVSAEYYKYDPKNPSKSPLLDSGPYYDLKAPGERLAKLCSKAGLQDVQERVAVMPIGWNGPLGNLTAAELKQLAMGSAKRAYIAGRDEETYKKLVTDSFKQAADEMVFLKAYCVTARVV
ncbi:hypothetical protein HK405_009381 [Cladochytrium tenue]|nr:hypothetical protein HK405_009381 [Cladochytrium tenue]